MASTPNLPARQSRRGHNVTSKGGKLHSAEHERSDLIARKVEVLAAIGVSQEKIAFACDLDDATLRKYYRPEIDLGRINLNHRMGAAMFSTALGEQVECVECPEETPGRMPDKSRCKACHGTGTVWRREPNTTAQIWVSKNLMGWTDKERIEHVGDGGGPVITEQRSSADVIRSKLEAIRKRTANDENGG